MFQKIEQDQLIEQIGIGIAEKLGISPLAARIYALLILSSYDGLSFDEIKERIKASKSSTSINIKALSQLGYIKFHTITGERKRYFTIAKYATLITLESYQKGIIFEQDILETINTYNKKYHPEKFTNEESIGLIFQEYLLEKQQLVERTIEKMKQFRANEK